MLINLGVVYAEATRFIVLSQSLPEQIMGQRELQ